MATVSRSSYLLMGISITLVVIFFCFLIIDTQPDLMENHNSLRLLRFVLDPIKRNRLQKTRLLYPFFSEDYFTMSQIFMRFLRYYRNTAFFILNALFLSMLGKGKPRNWLLTANFAFPYSNSRLIAFSLGGHAPPGLGSWFAHLSNLFLGGNVGVFT